MTIHDVFISYAREDHAMARRLASAFKAAPRGWSVWWDANLRTAGRFGREIREALEGCRCVVVIWSPHSVDSDWVTAEAEAGRKRGVLVPVRIAECEPPMPFGQIQTANLQGWRGSEAAPEWAKLLDAIHTAISGGAEVTDEERKQRQERMKEVRRRRVQLRGAIAAGLLLVTGLGWWAMKSLWAHREAERIAAHSVEVREAVLKPAPGDEHIVWWWRLFDRQGPLDQIQLSLLLGIEAFQRDDTAVTRRALRDAIALLPWYDKAQVIDKDNHPTAMVFSRDGRLLAAAGGRGDTLVWDLEEDRILTRIPHGGSGGRQWEKDRGRSGAGHQVVALSPDAKLLATAGPEATVRLWDPKTGNEIRQLRHEGVASSVEFSPDGAVLAATDESGEVRLWNPGTGGLLQTMSHERVSRRLFFSPSGIYLGTVGRDHTARIWEVSSGKEVARWNQEPSNWQGYIGGLAFGPDERHVVTYGAHVPVILWQLETGEQLWEISQESAGGAVFSLDGDVLVTGGAGSVTWWDVAKRKRLISVPNDYITFIDSDRERKVLTTATNTGGVVQAWDFESGHELRRIPYAKWPSAAAADPTGKWLASAGSDWVENASLIQLTRIRPDDLVTYGCVGAYRNFTKEEWQEYFGGESYSRTCPGVEDSPAAN